MGAPHLTDGVSPKIVDRAINSLLKWRASKSKTQKPQLLEQDEFVYLVLTLKKIPQTGVSRTNAHKIEVPNPLIDTENDNQLCLIIDDRPKSDLTKDAAQKKIQNDGIPISKIIKLSKLKSDYRPFEAKRKLCDSYDMFFADKRVIPLLPKMLGKHFFKKKKIPVVVNLKHKNWKEQISKACSSALLYLSTGTCSVVKVGRVSMGREKIVANVMAAINGIAEIVPKKWIGIRSFHLKLLESLALPIYQALPDLKLKIESGKEEEVVKEEIPKKKKVEKKKGRIHEIRYIDDNVNMTEMSDEDNLQSDTEKDINDENDEEDIAKLDEKREMGVEVKKEKKEKKNVKRKGDDGLKRKKGQLKVKNEDGVKKKKLKKDVMALESGEMKVKAKKKR